MFLAHLMLGLLLIGPFVVFGIAHGYNAFNQPNDAQMSRCRVLPVAVCLVMLGTGVALMRLEPFQIGSLHITLPPIKSPRTRSTVFWVHVIAPALVVWLYALHRLAGPPIKSGTWG